MQVIEKFGIPTALAFVSIVLGSKLVVLVLNHYFKREEIHDQNVKTFTEAVFEISSAIREKDRVLDRYIIENREDHEEILESLKRKVPT